MAEEVQRAARRLPKSLIKPVRHRPFEEEIADCKEAIVAFLKRRNVREVNRYGWVLLQAIFGDNWKPGKGKDQIEAFAYTRPVCREDKDPERRSDRDWESKVGMVQNATKTTEMMPTPMVPRAQRIPLLESGHIAKMPGIFYRC
ncbi:MAG TPA: hypothetical protein VLJ79_12635 [Candidatus Binatia bacterium]|nr:hypothetical protein [Candidatus Binatia bacterium]